MFFETSPTHLPPFAMTSVSASALTNSLNRPLKQTVLFLNMPTVSIRESPFMEELGSHGGDGRSAAALCTLLMEPHRPAPPLPPQPLLPSQPPAPPPPNPGWQLLSVYHAAVIDIPYDALCYQLGRKQLAEAAVSCALRCAVRGGVPCGVVWWELSSRFADVRCRVHAVLVAADERVLTSARVGVINNRHRRQGE
jgi:hypothetical protein